MNFSFSAFNAKDRNFIQKNLVPAQAGCKRGEKAELIIVIETP